VGILTGVIALGICTVTLWTPYPARDAAAPRDQPPPRPAAPARPAQSEGFAGITVTDEMIEQFLDDPFPRSGGTRGQLAAIIPVVHGLAAITTFVLAVMTASLALT
jgi:hypothetical protein